tara:strand:+ start:86 stop:1000 length:915 start_codon:yes stop_codon:yes gene_type:complete
MSNKTHEDVTILGIEHHLAVDPESLNEAGVVWTPAVRALASAVAPIVEARQASHSLAASSSDADGTAGPRSAPMRVLELGAGTGALGIALACSLPNIHVTLTDLAPVVPLMRENADATRDAGKLADGSETHVAELAWSRDAVLALNGGGDASSGVGGTEGSTHGGRDTSASRSTRWDLVLGCEILYWGGWDVFADDTRGPLLEACIAACEVGGAEGADTAVLSPPTLVVLAFTVRDQGRESGFVSKDFGEKFWLRLLDGGADVCVCGDEDEETLSRMDAEARARTDAAEEGDLLVLGAVAKRSK